ncbi:hypothetical protein Dgeo_2971 (plasmid) [Deinococcus geothermalis DSM 11300]|uniref:Uncharacterized protein n=1 Tax=Deinococcus geothermalis (strain DSM 11300 / CIP 105573 / AG-3a) TaxID=319795 RepID=A8ZRA5_DEIGD|nr:MULTISPECIES: hypothetical protein [Deinococcus]ABW35014.1 hypothetical protein Dgeo_2971 [Deinococcus geothermalis DSM 11300]TDE84764.1 hypothetical protein E0686_15305 [Deinococcus sp. S9]
MTTPSIRRFELVLPDCQSIIGFFDAPDFQAADHLRALYTAGAAVYQLDACPAQVASWATFRAPVHAVLAEVPRGSVRDVEVQLRALAW